MGLRRRRRRMPAPGPDRARTPGPCPAAGPGPGHPAGRPRTRPPGRRAPGAAAGGSAAGPGSRRMRSVARVSRQRDVGFAVAPPEEAGAPPDARRWRAGGSGEQFHRGRDHEGLPCDGPAAGLVARVVRHLGRSGRGQAGPWSRDPAGDRLPARGVAGRRDSFSWWKR